MQCNSFFLALIIILSASCAKKKDYICASTLEITANNSTPTTGESLVISANTGASIYNWTGPQNFAENKSDGSNSISFDNIKINQSGWYYCGSSLPGCNILFDSIYIDVQYKQGNPSCSLTDNVVEGDAVPALQAYNVSKQFDLAWNSKTLYASGTFGYPTYKFGFNSYNGNTEPVDGIHITTDVQSFNPLQDADLIYIQCQYNNYLFKSQPDQEIFVSHENGKLRIRFCNVKFSGDNGNSILFTSIFTGQVTEK